MEIKIKKYSGKDLSYIKNYFENIHDYVVSIDPLKRIRKMPGYLDVFFNKFLNNIKNNQGEIFIAEDQGKPIGFVAGFVADKQSKENLLEVVPSQLGIISDIYVALEYRGKKVGKKLMKIMEEDLISKDCDAIWVDTNSFNIAALHLYKSAGFLERETGLMKKI
jgi:ribosomal protein S18 acetylase RimI-like enzyme